MAQSETALSELREQYFDEGFAVLPGLFSAEPLERFEDHMIALASGEVAPASSTVIMQDVMVARGAVKPASPVHAVNKILSFEHDPILWGYSLTPALLEIVRSLIGPSLMTISTNAFNKPPGIDGRHPLHQDLRYFTLRPADGLVAAWTAISPCTRENGCLSVVPRSHRNGLLEHAAPDWEFVNSGFFAALDAPLEERRHIEMEPGDTLLFHPLLLHGSGRNRTEGFRRAISTHYASRACTRPTGPRKREPVTAEIPDD